MDRVAVDFEGHGIRRVFVVNQTQRADVVRLDGDKVRVRGSAADPDRGFIHHQDTVYLMGFEGTIECPPACLVGTRSGEADLEAALVRFHAPSFAAEFGDRSKPGAEPAEFRVIPDDVVARVTERFSRYNSYEWLAPAATVTNQVVLEWVELDRGNQRRFGPGGEHSFIQAAPSGDIVTIPELKAVKTVAQIPDAVGSFLIRSNIWGDQMSLMLDETSQLMTIRDPEQLRRVLEGTQRKLAELHGISTGAQQLKAAARSQMLEGIARLRELKVPFGAEMERFANGETPMSNEVWAALAGRVAAVEARLAKRDGSKQDLAPATSNVTRSNAAGREAANVSAASTAVTTYTMCLSEVGASILRTGFKEAATKHQDFTRRHADEYLKVAKEYDEGIKNLQREWPDRYEYEMEVDEKENVRKVRDTGVPCDRAAAWESKKVAQKPSGTPSAGTGSDGGSILERGLEVAKTAFNGIVKTLLGN